MENPRVGFNNIIKEKLKAAGIKNVKEVRALRLKSQVKFFRASVIMAETGYLDDETADVQIICQNGLVAKAHRIILCLTSEFFTDLFASQKPGKTSVITIPDIEVETMLLILTLIYKDVKLELTMDTIDKIQAWLEVFRMSGQVILELPDLIGEGEREQVQLIHPQPLREEQMREEPVMPNREPRANPVQHQQQVAIPGPSRSAQQRNGMNSQNLPMSLAGADNDAQSSIAGEPPVLERMADFEEPCTSRAAMKKHVRFATASPETFNQHCFFRKSESETREFSESQEMMADVPVKRKPGRPRKSCDRDQSGRPVPDPKKLKAPVVAAESSHQRDRSESPDRNRRRTRSRSRSRSKTRFDCASDRVDELTFDDYSGENRAKLLGTNPKSSRLKAKLKDMGH